MANNSYGETVSALDALREEQMKGVDKARKLASTVNRDEGRVAANFTDTTKEKIRPLEAQLANLQMHAQKATGKLATLQSDIMKQLQLPENERDETALDKMIEQAVMLRNKVKYFSEFGQELAAGNPNIVGDQGLRDTTPEGLAISEQPATSVPAPNYQAAKQLRQTKPL